MPFMFMKPMGEVSYCI